MPAKHFGRRRLGRALIGHNLIVIIHHDFDGLSDLQPTAFVAPASRDRYRGARSPVSTSTRSPVMPRIVPFTSFMLARIPGTGLNSRYSGLTSV